MNITDDIKDFDILDKNGDLVFIFKNDSNIFEFKLDKSMNSTYFVGCLKEIGWVVNSLQKEEPKGNGNKIKPFVAHLLKHKKANVPVYEGIRIDKKDLELRRAAYSNRSQYEIIKVVVESEE